MSLRSLLLIDCDERSTAMLEKSLLRLGMSVSTMSHHADEIAADVFAVVVGIDDMESHTLISAVRARQLPIIALSRHEALSQIQAAIRIGATAMLNKPFTQSAVYTTVMMAHGLNRRMTELEAAAERGDITLRMRPLVARTVARLMVESGIDEQQAFERIRTMSMSLNVNIETICVDLETTACSKGGAR